MCLKLSTFFYSGNIQSFIRYNLFLQALIWFCHRRHYFSCTIYSKVNLSYCQWSMLMWLKGLYVLRPLCHSGHHSAIGGRVIFCEKQPYEVVFPQNNHYWNSAHYKPLKHTATGNRDLYVTTRKNRNPCSTLHTNCSHKQLAQETPFPDKAGQVACIANTPSFSGFLSCHLLFFCYHCCP